MKNQSSSIIHVKDNIKYPMVLKYRESSMKRAVLPTVKAFLTSTRPKTIPLCVISVYIGGLVSGAAINSVELLLAVMTSFFIGSASMTMNDYFDREIDKISHPERPIPRGIIRPIEMLAFSSICFVVGIIISFFLNPLCLGILVVTIVCILMYEFFSKNRGIFGNITVAFASAISFVFGGAAVHNPYSALILSIITFLSMTGREILCDIKDIEGDRLVRRTVPIQIGKQNASYIVCLFLVSSIVLLPVPYFLNLVNLWYLIIIIPVGVLILLATVWVFRDTSKAAASSSLIRISGAIALFALLTGILL